MGVEAGSTLIRLASRLAIKWWQPYSRTGGYVKIRIDITLVWATQWCIWESRVLEQKIIIQRLQWEDGTIMKLFR